MAPPAAGLPRPERLRRQRLIDILFQEGKTYRTPSLVVRWAHLPQGMPPLPGQPAAPVQVLVGAPKKHFRRAHVRNRHKRRLRQVYRLHKHLLPAPAPPGCLLLALLAVPQAPPAAAEVPWPLLVQHLQQALAHIARQVLRAEDGAALLPPAPTPA